MISNKLQQEIKERTELNFNRLSEEQYSIENVFQRAEYDWDGDFEGRALLAFVCHYKISGKKILCMDEMMNLIKEKLNEKGYRGNIYPAISEQQLSGHSWFLRGLAEYYECFGDERALEYMTSIFNNLYKPLLGIVKTYPVDRGDNDGGVSGHSTDIIDGWMLSTDVGCAFMSIDGLSHYYCITKDEVAIALLDEMIDFYVGVDKVKLKAQTHCTLTAARGMLRLYEACGNEKYLEKAMATFENYVEKGMTCTYQNYNWFGREDTWTEPCAIVDSLILAIQLYNITGCEKYKTLAKRIFANGFASAQRPNGGAGTDTTVRPEEPVLSWKMMYEAYFCCTMRFAEGLVWVNKYPELLETPLTGELEKDEYGRYFDGDVLFGEIIEGDKNLAEFTVEKDGHILSPLVKYYKIPTDEQMFELKQRVIFLGGN